MLSRILAGVPTPHQIPGFVGRKNILQTTSVMALHFLGRGSYQARQSTNCISLPVPKDSYDGFSRLNTKVLVWCFPEQWEKAFVPYPWPFALYCCIDSVAATFQPAMSHFHRLLGVFVFTWPGCALVKGHDDISSNGALYIHGDILERKTVWLHPVWGCKMNSPSSLIFLRVGERINLISSAIRSE